VSQEQIIAAIQTCARQLGRVPTRVELKQIAGISYPTLRYTFGNMARAVREAGFEPTSRGQSVSDENLLLDWARVVRDLGLLPGVHLYEKAGQYTRTPFFGHFGSWRAVPDAFRDFAQQGNLEAEWQDVLQLIGSSITYPAKAPSHFCAEGTPSLDDERKSPLSQLPSGRSYRKTCFRDRPLAGPPIDLEGVAFEPVNELGVVFFFGMFAHRLGFRVLTLQQDFPDCEAMYEVRPGKWQRVRIEFEYESRNFHRHRHHPEGCDVIICWRHNWTECPRHLQVIELSKIIAQL